MFHVFTEPRPLYLKPRALLGIREYILPPFGRIAFEKIFGELGKIFSSGPQEVIPNFASTPFRRWDLMRKYKENLKEYEEICGKYDEICENMQDVLIHLVSLGASPTACV